MTQRRSRVTATRETPTISRRANKKEQVIVQQHSSMPVFLMIGFLFVMGGGYLYSVNQNAVQGFHMRSLEKDITRLKEENTQLQIKEADQRSLVKLEESLPDTQFKKVTDTTVLREEDGSVALK